MTIKDEIIAIANQLANQGKKPSVALIKKRLSSSVALPMLISTLKNWQHEPERVQITQTSSVTEHPVCDETLTKAEVMKLIAPLQAEITQMKALLVQLEKQIKQKS